MTPDQEEAYKRFRVEAPILREAPVNEFIGEPDDESKQILQDNAEKAVGEANYYSWHRGEKHYPLAKHSDNNKIKVPTPQEAKEEGMLGKFMHGTSDAVLGLYAGVGYGMDELAVSASKVLNMTVGTPEYQARAISEYMKGIQQKGVSGNVAKAIGQFMIGWMPWTRAIGLLSHAGKVGKAIQGNKLSANFLASSLTGGTAFAPNHKNLFNSLNEMDIQTGRAISEMWATNPNDPEWQNRLRNALEFGSLNFIGDVTLVPAAQAVGRGIKSVYTPVHEQMIKYLDLTRQAASQEELAKYGIQGRGKAFLSMGDDGKQKVSTSAEMEAQLKMDGKLNLDIPKGKTASSVLKEMDEAGTLDAQFRAATTLEEKGILANNIAKQLHDERQIGLGAKEVRNIKWAKDKSGTHKVKINKESWSIKKQKDNEYSLKRGRTEVGKYATLDHAKKFVSDELGEAFKRTIPRRTEEQVLKESAKLYEEVGMNPEMVRGLPTDAAWNDTQIFMFGRLAQSTHREMLENVAKHTSAAETDPLYKEIESRAIASIANHADTMAYLEDSFSALARGLQRVSGVRKFINQTINADHINSPELAEVLRSGKLGGHDISRMSQMILQAYETNGASMGRKALIEGIAKNEGGFWNQFVEAWINQGLLSNPATHALNTFSGGGNIIGHIGSQMSAAAISKLPFTDNKVLFREAFGSIYGLMQGLTKAMRLAFRASVTNQQVVTKSTKIDNYGFKHLAAEHIGKGINGADGTAIGLGVDFMGSLNRLPGRFLLVEDEFVKSVAYEVNLHSKAWKYAWKADGPENQGWMTTRDKYKDIINNPTRFEDEMGGSFHEQGQNLANLVTFQKDVGTMVNRLSGVMQDHPYLKLFVPFLKVLTNIPKYVIQHSPVGFVGNEAFKQGGAARMLEIGRMSYGTMLMMYGGHLYNTGQMTATGPRPYPQRKNPQDLGLTQETSIKFKPSWADGDEYWVEVSRFAPFANLMQMGTDIADLTRFHKEEPDMHTEMVWKGLASVQKNLISGTWAPNLHKLLGALADDRMEPKDWQRVAKSLIGTFQPSYVRAYEKKISPERPSLKTYHMESGDPAEAQPSDWSGFAAKIKAVSVGQSDEIVNDVNAMGDEVKRHISKKGGLAGILTDPVVSFVTFKKVDDNPVLQHIFGGSSMNRSAADKKKWGRDLELPVSEPSDIIKLGSGGFKIRLTGAEHKELKTNIKEVRNGRGLSLKEAFTKMYHNPWYQALPSKADGKKNDKEEMMLGIYNHYKSMARNKLIYDHNLHKRARAVKSFMSKKLSDRNTKVAQ